MPILPLDHPEPFAATIGVMLYPGTAGADPIKARALASQVLAEPLRQFHQGGQTLSYDDLLRIATDGGQQLTDLGERIWGGSATGEVFKALFVLVRTDIALASWNNAIKIAELTATRYKASGSRTAAWDAIGRFLSVAHLWAAWCMRERQFVTYPDVGYDGYEDFQSFLTESEILRDFGQNWRPRRANGKPPLPEEVWRVPPGWAPLERQPGWPPTGRIPLLTLPRDLLADLKPTGRPRKQA